MAQINTRIIIRNDSSFNWVLNEEVILLKGEFGVEFLSDGVAKAKIGDGVTPWKNLPYFGGEELISDETSIVIEDKVIKLKGFKDAVENSIPIKSASGELKWIVPEIDTIQGLKEVLAGFDEAIFDLQEIVAPEGEQNVSERVTTLEELVNGNGPGSVEDKIDVALDDFMKVVTDNDSIDTVRELIEYVAEHGKEVGTIIAKLDTIEEGAQVNLLEGLTVAGKVVPIEDKIADIAVANLEAHGVVKSATGTNKVNIANDGTMRVSKVDVNSIVVPIGEEVILNGGTSSNSKPVYATSIGNIGYASVEEAINSADNGDVVTLQSGLDLAESNLEITAENVVIDLNNYNLTANGSNGAIKVAQGTTTLSGKGEVHGTLGADNYSMAVWAENGTVVIDDGFYTNSTDGSVRGTDLIYVSGTGKVIINGGTFEAAKPEWTLNVKDADYKAGRANIIVKGGKFKNFDPANNAAEGAGTNFVALGYQSVKEGDYYVVKPL